jgi:protein ImuB
MRIPSYDDLTPAIPEVSPDDIFTSVAVLLPAADGVASRQVEPMAETRLLFAALHGSNLRTADGEHRTANGGQRMRNAAGRIPGPADPQPAIGDTLFAIASDFSPRIERRAGGTVVLDIAGLQRLLGDAARIAGDLARAGAPRVAVATSQIAAILLARAAEGVTVAAGDPETALRDVPIGVLEQFLVESGGAEEPATRERTFDVARRWGLSTLGELAALPAAELSARLGVGGVAIQRLARGIDPRPLVPDPGVTRFRDTFELEWPIDTLEPLSFVFARLLDPLASALERADRGAVALHLDLRLTDRTTYTRAVSLPAAMRDPRVLRTLLLLDLESHPPPAAVDVVGLELDPAPARIVQYSLLERATPSPETLATLMARLGALMGESRCGSPALVDSHRPDGFRMQAVAFGDRKKEATSGVGNWELGVVDAAPPRSILRRLRPPVAIRVVVEGSRPAHVAIDRRGMPGGAVQQAAGPWRTSGGWWERARWNRDEWDVALSDGSVCRLFRDRDRGIWFLDGVVD